MAKLKTGPKVVIIIAGVALAVFGVKKAAESGLIPMPGLQKASVAQKVSNIETKETAAQNVAPMALPGTKAANVSAPMICGSLWEWNAQAGLIFANGGTSTVTGSLMEKRGVNLTLRRQDDTGKMQEELIKCAKEIAGGATQCDCSSGANFVVIMGGGTGQFASGVNPQLAKLGPNYTMRIIGAVGRSYGEDAAMFPPEVKTDPKKAKGLLCSGVIRDDDWHIAVKWAADNDIPINPDEKTWDPDAINWVNSSDYNVAAQDYVAGKCEDRKVVKDGRPTSETKRVCVSCTVTWTPGDVTAAKNKGGLVKVASTKHYLMPAVIVGPKAFFDKNRSEVQGMLAAIFEAGDQLKSYDPALKKAMEISAKLYNDQDAAYWYKYFKGTTEKDATGVQVELGGSAAWNLADVLTQFGMLPGKNDNVKSVYTTFAGYDVHYYPALFKDTPIPEAKDILDKSFIRGAQDLLENQSAPAEEPKFAAADPKAEVVSKRSYRINFETGQAALTPEGEKQLAALKDSVAITELSLRIDGFTDNVGSDTVNIPLSKARAQAVRTYLQRVAPESFPDSRFVVAGYGSQQPVASNSTSSGRALNRRVDITLVGQ